MTIDEKPQERHSPLPSHKPEGAGEQGQGKVHPDKWLAPDVGRELRSPPVEGQR